MILVADSGSSKADWAYAPTNGEIQVATSIGVNPNLHSVPEIRTVIESVCPDGISEAKVTHLYYYGTGIWDHSRAAVLEEVLQANYPHAAIEVHHDLLGAARAACQGEPGIACILGTGSNSCLYKNDEVVDNVTNLGWLLGDEGSGVDLGKRLIRAYSYRELSAEDCEYFEETTGHNRASIGDGLYGKGNPNRFLASFSPFIHGALDRPRIRQLVLDAMSEFVRRHVLKYPEAHELPVSFVGSIAFHYQDCLQQVLTEHSLKLGQVRKKPIEALVAYHRSQHAPSV